MVLKKEFSGYNDGLVAYQNVVIECEKYGGKYSWVLLDYEEQTVWLDGQPNFDLDLFDAAIVL